ncbi:MAG: ParB/RepB/Spo0J family partition protein [Candidatus Omnitrophica bacterium]|nr:ParB/RepB/Spo0J family partition protein [Candidatus Omnitrophota bacterium]
MERKVLGKGLSALINAEPAPIQPSTPNVEGVVLLDPGLIRPNRYQPRLVFKEDKLQELANSIQEKGVVQPVVVRKNGDNDYELVAGERRLRAVKALGRREIPAVVRSLSDREMLELSIIENIQRDDLNPLEEATAYQALIDDFGFTQEQVAQSVGKNRSTVANMLRLLSLPEKAKDALFKERITFGHAKVILGLGNAAQQLALLEKILSKGLSVREAEQYAVHVERHAAVKSAGSRDEHVQRLEEELQHVFGTKVMVMHGTKRGKIQIEYYSLDDLERILAIVRR